MFVTVLLNTLTHLIMFIGCVYLAGFIISLLNKLFYKLAKGKRAVVYATGFIGTPIHESSHALMCLLFGHKITEIKFFQINDEDGVLGYVNHQYNPKNIWHQIGNYFIGVAPILVSSILLFFSMKFLLPISFEEMNLYFSDLMIFQEEGIDFTFFQFMGQMFGEVGYTMLTEITSGITWWIFFIFGLCIALHMNLSSADLKGSVVALPIISFVILVVNLILGLLMGFIYDEFIYYMSYAGMFVVMMMVLAVILSVFCVIVVSMVRGSISLVGILKNIKLKK